MSNIDKSLVNYGNTCYVNALIQCWRSLGVSDKIPDYKKNAVTLKGLYTEKDRYKSDPQIRMIEQFPKLFPNQSSDLKFFINCLQKVTYSSSQKSSQQDD